MSKPLYSTVRRALYRESAPLDAAECHGVLCGMLCAQGSLTLQAWMEEFLEQPPAAAASLDESIQPLHDLFDATLQELNSEDLVFEPYLPDTDVPLHERTQALASWCQGYLYGLGASGIGERSAIPENTRELIGDFSALAQAETGAGAAEELEDVYAQLVEFVRVGVLLIQEELQPLQPPPQVH